jgi:serine/threonine protein phosphatase 1
MISRPGRTFVVGDIHGCYHTLLELLDALEFDVVRDLLCSTGDLVDRGKYSLEVLKLFMDNPETFKCVRGNHDHKFLRWLKGLPVILSRDDGNYGNHYDLNRQREVKLVNSLIQYLDSLPLALHVDGQTTVVHAGLPPELDHRYVNELFDSSLDILMYIRHWQEGLDPKMKSRHKIIFDASLPKWYDLYTSRAYGGTVFFGHQVEMEGPVIRSGATKIVGLDTGAAFGGSLTAFCIEEEKLYHVSANSADMSD